MTFVTYEGHHVFKSAQGWTPLLSSKKRYCRSSIFWRFRTNHCPHIPQIQSDAAWFRTPFVAQKQISRRLIRWTTSRLMRKCQPQFVPSVALSASFGSGYKVRQYGRHDQNMGSILNCALIPRLDQFQRWTRRFFFHIWQKQQSALLWSTSDCDVKSLLLPAYTGLELHSLKKPSKVAKFIFWWSHSYHFICSDLEFGWTCLPAEFAKTSQRSQKFHCVVGALRSLFIQLEGPGTKLKDNVQINHTALTDAQHHWFQVLSSRNFVYPPSK